MTEPLIVCVDDDADVARLLGRAFKRERLKFMSTTEPEEALEWVLENDVALLVSDVSMPVMTGIELASRVRNLRPTTVRVLITGNLDIDTAMASINQGEVFRFVPKPIRIEALVSVVHAGIALHHELAAVAAERAQAVERARVNDALEKLHPTITTPARAHDGAYLVQRRAAAHFSGLGLDPLLALRK